MLSSILEWLYPYRLFFACVIAFCGIMNNYIHWKHITTGKCRPDDFGYLIRLWRSGDRDGRIVMWLSIVAIVSGVILIALLFAG